MRICKVDGCDWSKFIDEIGLSHGLPSCVINSGFSVQLEKLYFSILGNCGSPYRLSELNDDLKLTFNQIADLAEGKTVEI